MTTDNSNDTANYQAIVDADNPWPGLIPYGEADQKFFFGRALEIDALFRRVKRKRVSVQYAASGVGKSSLLEAGLFPRMREENYLPISIRMDFSKNSPAFADQALAQITQSAKSVGVEAPKITSGETLWEYFHRPDADFWNKRNRLLMPVLVFDQFEEFFTLGRRDQERAQKSTYFLEQLIGLAEGRPPQDLRNRMDANPALAGDYVFGDHSYKILISLREDFLAELEPLQSRMSDLALNRFRLLRMHGDAAMQVVTQESHLIDESVAEQVVRFVAAEEGQDKPLSELEVEPALLSVICRELNNRRQRNSQEKITASLLHGSETEILNDFYERSVKGLPVEMRTFIEEQLLTVSGYRDSVAVDNMMTIPGLTREDLNILVDRRLVRIDTRAGYERLELTHDRIAEVIRDSRDLRRQTENERLAAEREQIVQDKLRRSTRLVAAFMLLSLSSIALAGWGLYERNKALKNETDMIKMQSQFNALKIELSEASSADKEYIAELEAEKKALISLQEISDKKVIMLSDAVAAFQSASSGSTTDIDAAALNEQENTARLAVKAAASLAATKADQAGKEEQEVVIAQRKYYESFRINVQFKSSAVASDSPVAGILSGLGFVAGPARFTVLPSIDRNEVVYYDPLAEDEARFIADNLRPTFSDIDIAMVRNPSAARNILIRIAHTPE